MGKSIMDEAVILVEEGRINKAEEKFRQLYDEDKKNAEVNFYLGSILFKRDEYDQALDFLNKAEKLNDQDYRVYEILGQTLGFKAQRAGLVKGAMMLPKVKKAFQKALELNPDSLTAREGLYMFYLFVPGVAGGDESKALELAEEIKSINTARGHMVMAIYNAKHKNTAEAQKEFDQASELGKDDPEIQQKAGQFYLDNKKAEKAAALFDQLIALQPDNPAGYSSKGDYFVETGDLEAAIGMYGASLQKNPKFFPARYKRAGVFRNMGNIAKAKEDYQYIINNHPKTPFAGRSKEAMANLK